MSANPSGIYPNHTRVSPVFVLGHARSGTSLMCRLLLDHLGVNFGTESQFIVRYQQKLARYGDLSDDRRLRWLLDDISRERFFARTRQNFGFVFDVERAVRSIGPRTYSGVLSGIFEQFAASQGLARWGDKTPDYCRHLPLIRELFPDAQFLHVVRDGRDVAHSIFKTGFGPKNAYEAAIDWKRTVSEIKNFRATVPDQAFAEVQYEDLLKDPVKTVGEIAVYLGIDNHDDVLAAATPRLRSQVRGDNSLKWKQHLTWREVECFEAFAGDELQAFGYPLQFRPRTGRRSAAESFFWQSQALVRRLGNRRYWADNWYKLGLRFRDAALALRAFSRHRERDPWSARGLRP